MSELNGVGPTRLDRAIARVSPERALRRARARAKFGALTTFLGAGGSYSGARGDKRSMKQWWPSSRSADADTVPDLETLRGRSRDLGRNSPLAGAAIDGACTSIVGQGLMVNAAVDLDYLGRLGVSEEEAQRFERDAERVFAVACRQLDWTGEQHFSQMQDLVLHSQLESGDILVIRRFQERPGHLLGLKIQTVEADRIATPYGREQDPKVVEGVEMNEAGVVTRYHVRNHHPHDFVYGSRLARDPEQWREIRARRADGQRSAMLVFERSRPEQTRGVPYLASVIEPLKQLERYTEAELMAAVIASFFTVFVKTESGDGLANITNDSDANDPTTGNAVEDAPDYNLGPGAVGRLRIGEDISTANPGRPNASFDPFVMAVLSQVGARLQIPREVLLKSFMASYSASKAALNEAWRFFSKRRNHLTLQLCRPVYEWAIEEAVLRGLLVAPGFFDDPRTREAWLGSTWTGRPMGQIDPLKESNALKVQLNETRIISHSEAAAEARGVDYDHVVAMRARDRKTREMAGEEEMASAAPQPTEPAMMMEEREDADDVPEEADRA